MMMISVVHDVGIEVRCYCEIHTYSILGGDVECRNGYINTTCTLCLFTGLLS
jgi:hypothetical protein